MQYTWIDILNCIMGIISAIGLIFINYYVYRLTNKNSKQDSYFTRMVELYYKIEEDSLLLGDCKETSQIHIVKRIEVNSTIMIYYLLRIPGFYKDRLNFMAILYDIVKDPYNGNKYIELSNMFKIFCREIRDKKKSSHRMSFDYDGKEFEY